MVCISLTGALPNSQNATFHKCMAAFLNSVSCLHPPQFHMSPPWALRLLLESIKTLPYEPMQADKLTWMSLLKVSLFFFFLLIITSTKKSMTTVRSAAKLTLCLVVRRL